MELERFVILSFALLYGLWGLLLIGHSLLQMLRKSFRQNSNENKATKAVSAEVDDANKAA
jgi:hypothetical protein